MKKFSIIICHFLSSKMYQVDASKFTSKPDPKTEFARYFKSSGAAAALQKAMVLLYRMPVKPENVVEYFSEYFDNGAQRLMRISLLKAELCYKKDELEKHNERVNASEKRIQGLVDKLGISETEFDERFVPAEILEQDRLIILERYFKDLKRESEDPPEANFYNDDLSVGEDEDYLRTEEYEVDNKAPEFYNPPKANSFDADFEVMKKLDPWGILCGVPAIHKVKKSQSKFAQSKISTDANIPIKSELSLLMNQAQLEKGVDGNGDDDDDDGATLADVFQQFAFDSANLNQDDRMVKLHNQLLTVKKADPVKLGDLMGWSREDVRHSRHSLTAHSDTDKETFGTTREEDEATNFNEDLSDIDKLQWKPCQEKALQNEARETDAFLFEDTEAEDLIDNAYGMMDSDQGFVYEFPEHSRSGKHERGVCQPVDSAAEYQTCSAPISGDLPDWTYSGVSKEVDGDGDDEAEKWQGASRDGPIMRVDSSCHCIVASPYSTSELYGERTENDHKKESADGESKSKRKSVALEDPAIIAEDAALAKELDDVFKKNRRSSSVKNTSKNKKNEEIDDEVQDNVTSDIYGVVDLAKEIRRTILGTE